MTASTVSTPTDWSDPDDAPEWTDAEWDGAEFAIGDRVLRPAADGPTPADLVGRHEITLRLDDAVLDRLRSGGPDWRDRVNAILRTALGV